MAEKATGRVLLVDDEEEFLQALAERLGIRSIPTVLARDGDEALRIAAAEELDAVLLDHRMPGLEGIEVLRRLKRDQPELEVILLSGHDADNNAGRAARLGAFTFLQKPVDLAVLLDHLGRAREKTRRARTARAGGEAE